MIAISIELYW